MAWKFGPVIESVYHQFKHYGNSPIKELATDDFDDRPSQIDEKDTETKSLLDKIWEVYGELDAVMLSNITHEEKSPWSNSYKPGKRYITIDNKEIGAYFKKKIK